MNDYRDPQESDFSDADDDSISRGFEKMYRTSSENNISNAVNNEENESVTVTVAKADNFSDYANVRTSVPSGSKLLGSSGLGRGRGLLRSPILKTSGEKNKVKFEKPILSSIYKMEDANGNLAQVDRPFYNYFEEPRLGIGNIPLNAALTTIPSYDGRPETIKAFEKVIRDILATYGSQSEKWVLNTIGGKLKGRAKLAYGGIAPAYESVDQLLQDLKLTFGGIQDADTIRLELRRVEQDFDEPVCDYALRVQNLEQRLLSLYDSSVSMTPNERDYQKKRTKLESLECFLYGLKNPPEYRVSAKKPMSLREAANIAVNLEGRSKVLERHENCAVRTNKNCSSADRSIPQRNLNYFEEQESDASSDSSVDLNKLWALLAPLAAKVNITTTVKAESSYCKSPHELKTCQKFFKAIESGKIKIEGNKIKRNNDQEYSNPKQYNQFFLYPLWANPQNKVNQGFENEMNNFR